MEHARKAARRTDAHRVVSQQLALRRVERQVHRHDHSLRLIQRQGNEEPLHDNEGTTVQISSPLSDLRRSAIRG